MGFEATIPHNTFRVVVTAGRKDPSSNQANPAVQADLRTERCALIGILKFAGIYVVKAKLEPVI